MTQMFGASKTTLTHSTVPPEVSVFNPALGANETNASQILNTMLGAAPIPPAPPPLAELGYPVGVPPVPTVPPVPGLPTVAPLPVVPNPPACTTDLSTLIYLVSGRYTEMRWETISTLW